MAASRKDTLILMVQFSVMVTDTLQNALAEALNALGMSYDGEIHLEHPADVSHGDYSTNIAMILASKEKQNPRDIAQSILGELDKMGISEVQRIAIAGAGFINFYLSDEFLIDSIKHVIDTGDAYGTSDRLSGKKVMIEYTDPNVMKPFHIGHLMSNAIGESFARLGEAAQAEVKRANYFSDVGLGIAKAVWGMRDLATDMPKEDDDITTKTDFLGRAYVHGVQAAEKDASIDEEIKDINTALYEKSNEELTHLYDTGRRWSLEHFEVLYKILGTEFDFFYPESEIAARGKEIVEKGQAKGVFRESDGAVVFVGEEHGLHTRVFINQKGIATYEAKELGLNERKYKEYQFDESVIITAHEQDAYFDVVLKAMEMVLPDITEKTKHMSHGMMRFADSKMSSRTGNVITGETLIRDVQGAVYEKMKERDMSEEEKKQISQHVALGAIKYSILKQAPGKDIIFDREKALSFEGDSGPYLQYTYVRTQSVLKKARVVGIEGSTDIASESVDRLIERKLHAFTDVVIAAQREYAPQYVATYLTELASLFNSFYAREKIIVEGDTTSSYKVALTDAVGIVLKNGLFLLGITAPTQM